ncbi:hypothetical protein L7F22_062972 [Adiantum nelumboides]|nr:hypothetical protein [Adiantum nelumboides]
MGEPSSSWQNFNFRDDEGSAQGMQALRLLLAKLQEAQANPRLKPSVNNLLMTEDLMLTSTQRLPSSVAPMHLEGGEGVPVMHGPMQANVVPHPLQGPLQTDGAKKKQYHGQKRHVGKIREEGDFHDDDDEPPSRSRHKKRTNERCTKRSRRNSSGGSSSSSQSGRSSHGRFPKKVAQKLRRLGVVQQEALLSEVNKLLKSGFIYSVTNSEWVSPVVVTPKKNGKWRVCVDYKPLNAATKRDHFPLPFQDEILNEVAGHERYTICDGYSGYYQIRIAEEDQHKTTFITPWGCFAFRVMPFGLTNAPSTFTRFTNFIFQPFFGKSIRVFLDDFCTYSDRALHCQRVEEGLQRLYQYGGQLNPDKCHVAEKEVVLLGHVISQEGIKVDPSHVQAILDLPPPNSARQVITFVQKVRYMSRFIHLLSQIISPLQKLANQEVFSWEQEHLECFNEVKEVLGSLPTIMPPDRQGTYYLCPSVGLDAFGAVLMQKDPKTAYMRPIYFTSKVGDFGLARWQLDGDLGVQTRVIGTFGYLALEYAQSGQITEKADVYSFGVVLSYFSINHQGPGSGSAALGCPSAVHSAWNLELRSLDEGQLSNRHIISSGSFNLQHINIWNGFYN